MIDMFKMVGVLGLVLIIVGVLLKDRKTRDYLYIPGGVFLTVYSFHLNDLIFIILQVVFTVVAIYDLIKIGLENKAKKKKK